jgi:hypothetical protein
MLPNEEFALACREWYAEQGLVVDGTNGEFAHCPYPEGMGNTGYYLLHEHHQHQGLLQSKDLNRCCFFGGHAKHWLVTCEYFPDNYFELWDIYEEYYKEPCSAGGVTCVAHNLGIHDPAYRESEVYKSINKEGGRRGGTTGKLRKTGIHDPVYRASEEYRRVQSKRSKSLVERRIGIFDPDFKREQNQRRSKPVVFYFPTGEILSFPSRMEAIRQTNISSSTLVRVLRNGKPIHSGRFKGVRIVEGNG